MLVSGRVSYGQNIEKPMVPKGPKLLPLNVTHKARRERFASWKCNEIMFSDLLEQKCSVLGW